MKKFLLILTKIFLVCVLCVGIIFSIYFIWFAFQTPSNDRDWREDQKVLTNISFVGDEIQLQNIRDFRYGDTPTDFLPNYIDKTISLDDIVKTSYVIVPFGPIAGVAHTMIVFDFLDGTDLVVSPEIRREVGEDFSAVK